MKARTWAAALLALLLSAAPSYAAITFVDLGTAAPPASVGPVPVTPFLLGPQQAIANGSSISNVPGNPLSGSLTFSTPGVKETIGSGWATWSHGYTGPVYTFLNGENSVTLFLPNSPGAFYLYVEPNIFDIFDITATATDGTSSGPIPVNGSAGANGFGFFTTTPGQGIATIRIDVDPGAAGFAVGEFGIGASTSSSAHVPTLSEWGMMLFVSLLVIGALRQIARRKMA